MSLVVEQIYRREQKMPPILQIADMPPVRKRELQSTVIHPNGEMAFPCPEGMPHFFVPRGAGSDDYAEIQVEWQHETTKKVLLLTKCPPDDMIVVVWANG